MPNSQLTTMEEAKLCPKCGRTGEDRKTLQVRGMAKGTTVHLIYCVTELCRWFGTPWQVQVNPDGSVPAPKNHTGQPKLYANIEGHDDQAKQLIEQLKKNAQAETEPGTEIRNGR